MDFSRQPLQGSDIAAFVFAVLALLFFALWRRDRERGMGWLAVAYVVLATQYAANSATLPVDALANPFATALLGVGVASFNCRDGPMPSSSAAIGPTAASRCKRGWT